jgi:ATP-binding cassette subfamily B protein
LNGPLSQFISFMQATQDAKISLERLGEIYDRPDEEPDDEPRIRTIPDSAPLEFRDVVFHYEGPNSERALDGVSCAR